MTEANISTLPNPEELHISAISHCPPRFLHMALLLLSSKAELCKAELNVCFSYFIQHFWVVIVSGLWVYIIPHITRNITFLLNYICSFLIGKEAISKSQNIIAKKKKVENLFHFTALPSKQIPLLCIHCIFMITWRKQITSSLKPVE